MNHLGGKTAAPAADCPPYKKITWNQVTTRSYLSRGSPKPTASSWGYFNGFLIRGQVPKLEGKVFEKKKTSAGLRVFRRERQASGFRIKHKIPGGESGISSCSYIFSRAGRPLFPGISYSFYTWRIMLHPCEKRLFFSENLSIIDENADKKSAAHDQAIRLSKSNTCPEAAVRTSCKTE